MTRKVTLPVVMARHNVGPMRLFPMLLAVATLASACGGGGSGSAPSPSSSPTATAGPQESPSPGPSALPAEGAYGVLVDPSSGTTYDVSLVGADGKLSVGAAASIPAPVKCADGSVAALPPPVSTSSSRAYFMDAEGIVRSLAPGGQPARATTVPVGTAHRRSTFAVSPDDKRIAVVVIDFNAGGAATSLYVEDLKGGANHKVIFTERGAFTLWPMGWHSTDLVVAKVPVCAQGTGPFCCGPQELYVIDASTAARKVTLGGPTCIIAGPPSAGGSICETDAQANVLDWPGATTRSFAIQGQSPAYLSPNSNQAAVDKANPANFLDTVVEGSNTEPRFRSDSCSHAECRDTNPFSSAGWCGEPGA